MKEMQLLDQLVTRYPALLPVKTEIWDSYIALQDCYASGHKLLVAGNGGSAADAEHMVGELMKSFVKKRPLSEELKGQITGVDAVRAQELNQVLEGALPSISLCGHPSLSSAMLNDKGGLYVIAQQVIGYGLPGDVFIGITTSGNAENIVNAAVVAKAKGLTVIGLTGKSGGELTKISDISVIVPNQSTYQIQEYHLPIYHALCLMLEEHFFPV